MIYFGGSFTPERPVYMAGGYGAGTAYPLEYKRYVGPITADDDIVRCQWLLNQVRAQIEGSITLQFLDPTGGGDPPENHTVNFNYDIFGTATITGADASVRYPTNLIAGDRCNIVVAHLDTATFATTWGTASINIEVQIVLGGSDLGISDTTFDTYQKSFQFIMNFVGVSASAFNSDLGVSSTSGGTLLGNFHMLHATIPLYSVITGSGSVSFTTCKLTRFNELPLP